MRKLIVLLLVLLPIGAAAPAAEALPSSVALRIEGKEETLFEGRVPTVIKPIRASSDSQERACDGINSLDPQNTAPGITPTLAAVEAMESVGETFDGKWYDGFDDYFITRWGPDAQVPAANDYWGVLVNQVYTNVGGCQYQLDEGDEALWVWDAFNSRPSLAMFPAAAGYTHGPRPTRAVADVNQPFAVEVVEYPDKGSEGVPCDEPSREGSAARAGATVAPVTVDAKGFQRIQTGAGEAVTTGPAGTASITFAQPGIHRIKATVGSPGAESAVRSNGLEVCVRASAGECGGFTSPTLAGAVGACHGSTPAPAAPSPSGPPSPPAPGKTTTTPATTGGGSLRLSRPRVDRSTLAAGKAIVDWTILDLGPGIDKWTVSSQTIGKKPHWVVRASGRDKAKASVTLPRGHSYRLRFAITDTEGRTSTISLGKVKVPEGRAPRGR